MDDKPKTTPKDFFLWAGAMITLYASVVALISLIFSYLDHAYPDALRYYTYYSNPYQGGVSYEMASLIVLYPIFLIAMRLVHRDIARDSSRGEVWIRRWALYLTLFVAGATIAGDLITLVMYFFNGDVTMRFLLKVLVVLLIASGGFLHFLADLRGHWSANPVKARMVAWATGALVALTIVAGFFIIGTPWQARLYRYDEQKVSDLGEMQYQIINYWETHARLPGALADLQDSLSNYQLPQDPQSGQPYEYRATGATSFELCATFAAALPSPNADYSYKGYPTPINAVSAPVGAGMGTEESWSHGAGRTCFIRTIDPARYPPINKPLP